jgi:hypothetical protein
VRRPCRPFTRDVLGRESSKCEAHIVHIQDGAGTRRKAGVVLMQGGTPKPVLEGNDILEPKRQLILTIDASPSGTRAGRRTLKQLMVGGCSALSNTVHVLYCRCLRAGVWRDVNQAPSTGSRSQGCAQA